MLEHYSQGVSEGLLPGLRQRKKEETRAALRAAATRLYLEREPGAVTVQDICAAAGVSPRTFFNYFDSKEEALYAWDMRLSKELVANLAARPAAESPLTALRAAIDDTLPGFELGDRQARNKLLRTYPELRMKARQGMLRGEDTLSEALGQRLGQPADSLYPQLLAGAAMSVLRAAFTAWVPETGTAGLHALIAEAFDALAAGLPG